MIRKPLDALRSMSVRCNKASSTTRPLFHRRKSIKYCVEADGVSPERTENKHRNKNNERPGEEVDGDRGEENGANKMDGIMFLYVSRSGANVNVFIDTFLAHFNLVDV